MQQSKIMKDKAHMPYFIKIPQPLRIRICEYFTGKWRNTSEDLD